MVSPAIHSFVLGLYNVLGWGGIGPRGERVIQAMDQPMDLKVLVSLSWGTGTDLVTAAQRLASANSKVTAEVYDLNHFPALREQYKVMSVPCLVMNDIHVSFGKKNVQQLWMDTIPTVGLRFYIGSQKEREQFDSCFSFFIFLRNQARNSYHNLQNFSWSREGRGFRW